MDTLDIATDDTVASLDIDQSSETFEIVTGTDAELLIEAGDELVSIIDAQLDQLLIDGVGAVVLDITEPESTEIIVSFAEAGPPGPPGPAGSIEGFDTDQYGRLIFDGGQPAISNGA